MKRKIVLIFTFIVFLLNSAYAKRTKNENAEKDLSLFEIDRLIRRTEYDEALKQLNNYILLHPDNFDNAQLRINRILNIRQQYSILAEKLIDMIITDPENSKEIYEIIAQLEKFERHPSDTNLQFIADLKKSTEFSYFRSIIQELEENSAALTAEKKYVEAVKKMTEGFWLYKEDYFDKWEENQEIIVKTNNILAAIDQHVEVFTSSDFQNSIETAINDFLASLQQDNFEITAARYGEVISSVTKYRFLQHSFYEDSMELQKLFDELQQFDEDTTDASFLPFMNRLITGFETVPDSGVLGAFENQWYGIIEKLSSSVFEVVLKNYSQFSEGAEGRLRGENEFNVDAKYKDITDYIGLQQAVVQLYDTNAGDFIPAGENPFAKYITSTDYLKDLGGAVTLASKDYDSIYTQLQTQKQLIEKIHNDKTLTDKQFNELFDISATGSVSEKFKVENSEFWNRLNTVYENYYDQIASDYQELQVNSWKTAVDFYKNSSDTLVDAVITKNPYSEKFRTGFYSKLSDENLKKIRTNTENAFSIENLFEEASELEIDFVYRYPDIALKMSEVTLNQIEENTAVMKRYLKTVNNQEEKSGVRKSQLGQAEVLGIVDDGRTYLQNQIARLDEMKLEAQKVAVEAQKQIVAYQLARNEADLRYAEAEASFRRQDFDNARKKLQASLGKYDEALNNQTDEKLRAECDVKLQSLGERITKAENEKVVLEVRELKTRAKDAFFNGRFDEAEKLLNQAKMRWAVTNVEEDAEITNLETYVSTAVSMNTGRDILPASPLYSEMSQLLNIAYQYFEEGSKQYKAGDKKEGDKSFDFAMENLQKLQLVYPLNQEASVLSLKINQIQNPSKFNEEFAQKVEAAKLLCQNKNTRQEGYANLLDYFEINPNFKGLKQLIYQTEIDIGIRLKPVDNSAEKKTKELITQAQKLFNSAGDNNDKLNEALAKINQALELDYNNTTATSLKDRIIIKIGGNNSPVLSTEDKRYYDLALQYLRTNKATTAKMYADRITNKNSKDVKDLKNKINAAL